MEIGQKYTSEVIVEERHLACNVGSGDLQVFGTPMMMALMENTAMLCVADDIDEGQSTVGGFISSSHVKPSGIGAKIKATAELVAMEGRKLTFKVSAEDEEGVIGEGEHVRFIIDKQRFMSKVSACKA